MRWLRAFLSRPKQTTPTLRAAVPTPQADDDAVIDVRARIEGLLARGAVAEARAAALGAADRFPDDVEINVLCGNACLAADDAEGALDAFHLALHYDPGCESALRGQAAALERLGRRGEVAGAFEAFVAANPNHAGALNSLARIASDAGDFIRSRDLLERALTQDPDHVGALNDLGLLLAREFADFARGEALLRRALRLTPECSDARVNLGWLLCEQRAYEEGFRLLDEATSRDPGDQETLLIRAVCRLKRGDFAAGWDDYETRHASPTARHRPFSFPSWDGTPLGEGRLLVYGEQGLGDQIMFAGCLPDVLARVPDCVVECEPRLGALFARSFPAARVVTGPLDGATPDWLADAGPIRRQIALGSLPRLLRRRVSDFPSHRGYLRADPGRVRKWRERLAACGPAPKIGISWRGGTRTSRRGLRSLELARLAPLMASIHAEWISLQYTDTGEELAAFARDHGITVRHWQEAIDDYDETAALVSALDVVASVCTSIVHLTGSLGRRALVMVPHAAEWRYGAVGESMLWYPSVRLLRQPAPGDWDAVLAALRRELLTCASAQA
jgi:tetratricopeptide (TPR) repeat protein